MNAYDLSLILPDAQFSGARELLVETITADSREVEAGVAFVAIAGTKADGNDFIDEVMDKGEAVIISEHRCPDILEGSDSVAWIRVKDARLALAKMAAKLFDNPSESLKIAGVTGTNGKTTVSYLIHSILQNCRYRAGLIGTIKNFDGVDNFDAKLTTPDSVSLQSFFSSMLDQGCREAVMEVSSIGVDQKRVVGTEFAVGVFTNLSQDHLDYHKNLEDYFQAKRQFFVDICQQKKQKARLVINQDDAYGERLANEFREQATTYTFGYSLGADFHITRSAESLKGVEFEFKFKEKLYLVKLPLIGRFNVYNAVTALVSAYALGLEISDIIASLEQCPQIPGRMEKVGVSHDVMVFVDYAHTPDALENVCSTIKSSVEEGRLITVFGCGGDRDKEKRHLMAQAVAKYSDFTVVTADNPRTEPIKNIIADIETGLGGASYVVEIVRDKAIEMAIKNTRPGDIILIAGKGHENYQIIGNAVIPFSDRSAARKHLDGLKKEMAIKVAEKEKLEEEERLEERRQSRQRRFEEDSK